MSTSRDQGKHAEDLAKQYLLNRSLTYICSNYRCKYGEIDLIMQDNEHLIFVEVRLRNNPAFGSGADTVSPHKQRRLRNTAHTYLQTHFGNRFPPCRFDVVSMLLNDQQAHYEWIKNAF